MVCPRGRKRAEVDLKATQPIDYRAFYFPLDLQPGSLEDAFAVLRQIYFMSPLRTRVESTPNLDMLRMS